MSGFISIHLKEMLAQIGEKEVKSLLSDFSCPDNPDVEYFLQHTAIEFAKQGISSTYLIFASYRNKYVLVGYYTLANKIFCIHKNNLPNRQWKSRLSKFGQFDRAIQKYTLSAPLIGQLGKNYAHSYHKLITGDELLKLALDKVKSSQIIIGGRMVYLECEDKPFLIEFYTRNGFINFGQRKLDADETDKLSGNYLMQMLKYLDK